MCYHKASITNSPWMGQISVLSAQNSLSNFQSEYFPPFFPGAFDLSTWTYHIFGKPLSNPLPVRVLYYPLCVLVPKCYLISSSVPSLLLRGLGLMPLF